MDTQIPVAGVIKGHQDCQTKDAKWLCIEHLFHKLHRPNLHDIGGTLADDVADFWFISKTERVENLFLLHILIISRRDTTFNVSISSTSDTTTNEKLNVIFLNTKLKNFKFTNVEESVLNYVTTYCFTEIDIESFKKSVYIPIRFNDSKQEIELVAIHNFEFLYKDPVGADFTIESMDGYKFQVHKSLLSASSEVFKAMLKEDTAESQNSYLKLIDVSKEDLGCILEFLYTGSVEDVENMNFCNLLMLADRYDLKDFRELSECILRYQLSLDNALATLVVADLYNSHSLKKTALHYIKANPLAIHGSMLKELKNVKLLQELCSFIAPNIIPSSS